MRHVKEIALMKASPQARRPWSTRLCEDCVNPVESIEPTIYF
jgi:hypothetical protein